MAESYEVITDQAEADFNQHCIACAQDLFTD